MAVATASERPLTFMFFFSVCLCMYVFNENFQIRIQAIMHINLYHLPCTANAHFLFWQLFHYCSYRSDFYFLSSAIFQINLECVCFLPVGNPWHEFIGFIEYIRSKACSSKERTKIRTTFHTKPQQLEIIFFFCF